VNVVVGLGRLCYRSESAADGQNEEARDLGPRAIIRGKADFNESYISQRDKISARSASQRSFEHPIHSRLDRCTGHALSLLY